MENYQSRTPRSEGGIVLLERNLRASSRRKRGIMSRYFANPVAGRGYDIDFATLVSLVKGTCIVSLADSDRFIELGLSENLLLRIEGGEGLTVQATLISTLNANEVSPMRLQLIAEGEEQSAALVERRLHSLRQVYAITLLLSSERGEEVAATLRTDPHVDLEQVLLRDGERLFLQAAGPGSWFVVATAIGRAPQAALNLLSLVYGEGRRMLLERVRAATDLKRGEVAGREIANARARQNAVIDMFAGLEKIKNRADRELAREILLSNMTSANPKLLAPTITKLLPPSTPRRRQRGLS
jgi:hypothetical protein